MDFGLVLLTPPKKSNNNNNNNKSHIKLLEKMKMRIAKKGRYNIRGSINIYFIAYSRSNTPA